MSILTYLYIMSRYCLNTPEVKKTKKFLLKYNEFEIKSNNIEGKVKITNWRKYPHYHEVDIVFEGQIWANYARKLCWIDSSILKVEGVSLIRCNKMIRKRVWKDLRCFLSYFGINLKIGQYTIKKVKWI